MAQHDLTQTIRTRGEALVAAAAAGDDKAVLEHTDFFVLGRHVDEGIPYWERAVEVGDGFSAFTLARYRKIRGDRAEAERLYRVAAEHHAGCAYGLGVLLRENGDPEAAAWFRKGWDMGRLDCKIELGKLLAAEGKLDEAPEFLMDGVGIGDIAVFRWVQLFEGMRKEFDGIAERLATAERDGDAEAARAALEPLSRRVREFRDYPGLIPEAEEYHRRAGALDPVALVDHAIFLDDVAPGRWDDSRALLLRAQESGYDGAAYVLGVLYEQRGELTDAEAWYTLAATTGHASARWNLAMLCKRQRRYDEAERWLRALGEEDPDVPDQLASIARIRGEGGVPPGKDLRRLPGLRERAEAGDVQASYAYGKLLHEWAGAGARAVVRWYEPAARAGDPEAAYDLAELWAELRDPQARDHWHRVAALAGHTDACSSMGWLSEYHKDYQEAERWYVRAADDGTALHAMLAGKAKAQRGAYEEAEPYLRRAWEEGRGAGFGTEAAGYYGLALNRLGRPAEAVEPLRVAADRWGDDVRPRYDPDDLDVLSRMADPEAELAWAQEALAACRDSG